MTGGLINIVSYGTQDIYLTGTPQISYFKIVYRRHTNFSTESIELPFDDDTGFSTISNKVLPLVGDLVHKIYLKIDLPELAFERIVLPIEVKKANDLYFLALNSYKNFVAFMTINSNAYRAAIDVYNAENIVYSSEMVNSIKEVFDSYSSDTLGKYVIAYYSTNTPIWYIQPIDFNLLLIANSIKDPSIYPKQELKILLDNALTNCGTIQNYYDTQLRAANTNRLDVINKNLKFAWIDRLGHNIIDYLEIYIGGERIDKHYGDWLNIWYELAGNKDLNDVYMKMIGDVPELTTFDRTTKPAYSMYIPLQFWFNKYNGLSIPLIALQYHEVTIKIKLKQFKECAYIEDLRTYNTSNPNYKNSIDLDDLFENNNHSLNASLFVDYVYLDTLERRRFAQSSHEYLIDQLQTFELKDIDQRNIQVRLDFFNPCKEFMWVAQKNAYVTNLNGFTKSRWNNYSTTKYNKGMSTDFMELDFNGYARIARYSGAFYNYLQPYYFHSNTPSDGINVYSFSLRPEEQQPTGTANFSRISTSFFNLWINPDMFIYYDSDMVDDEIPITPDIPLPLPSPNPIILPIRPIIPSPPRATSINIRWYAINVNVLRIISGIGGTAYQ